jgi:hypothetical protein
MATRTFTSSKVDALGRDTVSIEWAGLLNGDDGTPIELAGFADRSVQLLGTLGAGGNVKIEGSNMKTPNPATAAHWHLLNDPQGNALDVAALKTEQVLEFTRWIRPRVSAGDGTTSLTLCLTAVQK